jgi:uncharacterized membrane protein
MKMNTKLRAALEVGAFVLAAVIIQLGLIELGKLFTLDQIVETLGLGFMVLGIYQLYIIRLTQLETLKKLDN